LQYRTKRTTSSTWSDWSSLTNGTAVQADFDNNSAWNFQIQIQTQTQDKFTSSAINYILNIDSIFILNSANTSSYFEGIWNIWGSGRVLASQMPSHVGLARASAGSGYKESYEYTKTATREQSTYSDSAGGCGSHTGLNPIHYMLYVKEDGA
jgi:hypothetical protein